MCNVEVPEFAEIAYFSLCNSANLFSNRSFIEPSSEALNPFSRTSCRYFFSFAEKRQPLFFIINHLEIFLY